jgi:hypothetical protein
MPILNVHLMQLTVYQTNKHAHQGSLNISGTFSFCYRIRKRERLTVDDEMYVVFSYVCVKRHTAKVNTYVILLKELPAIDIILSGH